MNNRERMRRRGVSWTRRVREGAESAVMYTGVLLGGLFVTVVTVLLFVVAGVINTVWHLITNVWFVLLLLGGGALYLGWLALGKPL